MSRQKKLVNKTNIPEHEIEKIARCFYPDIVRDFMNEDIQREFAEWQAEQAARRATLKLHKTNKGATVSAVASVVICRVSASLALWALILGVSGSHWEKRHIHILQRKQIIRTRLPLGRTGSDYIALVRVFITDLKRNRVFANPLRIPEVVRVFITDLIKIIISGRKHTFQLRYHFYFKLFKRIDF